MRCGTITDVIAFAGRLGMLGYQHSNIKLTLALDPAIPAAVLDKVQIQQVMPNLVRNAVEAMANTVHAELAISSATIRMEKV
jgi:two-component system, LuxR family, sensor kinase FixL